MNQPRTESEQLHIRLPTSMLEAVRQEADAARRTMTAHVTLLIELGQKAYERNGKKVS